jgi:hypothetical protein
MKNKVFMTFVLIALFSIPVLTRADVRIQVANLKEKIMRVTYTWIFTTEGATQWVVQVGEGFADGPLTVLSLKDKKTGENLRFKVVQYGGSAYRNQAVRMYFPNPIPKGGSYEVELTAEAVTKNITKDKKGLYVFRFDTAQAASFVLPEGHVLQYSNYTVKIQEQEGNRVLQVKQLGEKSLIFKTSISR